MDETECPDEFELCLTYDEAVELDELISEAGAEYSLMESQPLGDVEAVANFTWLGFILNTLGVGIHRFAHERVSILRS